MSEQNPFDSSGGNLTGLAKDYREITPNDSTDLPSVLIGVRCRGAAGDISVVTAKGTSRTWPIELDETIPCGIVRILATGTTATGLWGFEG